MFCYLFSLPRWKGEGQCSPLPTCAKETVHLFPSTTMLGSTGWKNSSTPSSPIFLQRAIVENILLLMYLHRLEAEKLLTTGVCTHRASLLTTHPVSVPEPQSFAVRGWTLGEQFKQIPNLQAELSQTAQFIFPVKSIHNDGDKGTNELWYTQKAREL